MTHQTALFHDSIYDAIGADIAAIGGIKKTAAMLWPTNADSAGRLRACLSLEHPQKFDPEEILTIKRLARDVGSFSTVNYEAQELAFRVEWIKPEDERDQLRREFVEMGKRIEQIARKLQR